jgi:hypothetical protein
MALTHRVLVRKGGRAGSGMGEGAARNCRKSRTPVVKEEAARSDLMLRMASNPSSVVDGERHRFRREAIRCRKSRRRLPRN